MFMFALSSIFAPKYMLFITTRQNIDCRIVLEITGLQLMLFFPELHHACRIDGCILHIPHILTYILYVYTSMYMTASLVFQAFYTISQLMIIPLEVS